MLAWGLSNGQFTEASFASKAKAAGYEWAALELDDYGNAARWPAFRDHCNHHGLIPGVWFTDGWNIPNAPTDTEFVIAELESQGDLDGILAAPTPTVAHAVCTNFTPLVNGQGEPLPGKSAPLIAAGWHCLTESYIGDNPNGTPDTQDHFARHLGWGVTQPVFGVHSAPLSAYQEWMDWPGCDYLGEYVL